VTTILQRRSIAGSRLSVAFITIDAHIPAETGDDNVLRDVQTDKPHERADAEEPDVQRRASHEAEHRRDAKLEFGAFHDHHY